MKSSDHKLMKSGVSCMALVLALFVGSVVAEPRGGLAIDRMAIDSDSVEQRLDDRGGYLVFESPRIRFDGGDPIEYIAADAGLGFLDRRSQIEFMGNVRIVGPEWVAMADETVLDVGESTLSTTGEMVFLPAGSFRAGSQPMNGGDTTYSCSGGDMHINGESIGPVGPGNAIPIAPNATAHCSGPSGNTLTTTIHYIEP